jgi:hypothetical protein
VNVETSATTPIQSATQFPYGANKNSGA